MFCILLIHEMKIKITLTYYLIPKRLAHIKKKSQS